MARLDKIGKFIPHYLYQLEWLPLLSFHGKIQQEKASWLLLGAILCYQLSLTLFFCQAESKSSAWKAYMEEVKKYKEMTCSEDGDRVCPLVK